jgi:hypothetical protein
MTPLAAYVAEACRLYILIVLAAAAAGKASAVDAFRDTVVGLSGLSERTAGAAARAVIGAEAATFFTLVVAPRAGMAAAMAMFALFWTMILVALIRRRAVICNCFGGGAKPISWLDLVRNLAMVGACLFFLLSPSSAGHGPSVWLLLLGVALIAFLVSTNLDEIAAPAQ